MLIDSRSVDIDHMESFINHVPHVLLWLVAKYYLYIKYINMCRIEVCDGWTPQWTDVSDSTRLARPCSVNEAQQCNCFLSVGTRWRRAVNPTRPVWSGGRWPEPTAAAGWSEQSSAATCRRKPSDTESEWWVWGGRWCSQGHSDIWEITGSFRSTNS